MEAKSEEEVINKNIEKRKEKIKNWLKDKNNLIFAGILVFAVIIRIYYFNLTKNQPLWWDEADYMAYAKNLAGFSVDWVVTAKHNSLFPYLAALLFKLGFSEAITKFIIIILPSILLVLLAYKVTLLMYKDRRIALISSFLMATLWEILFNSTRFHLETPALLAGFLSIFVFWQGYERKEKIFGKIDPKWALPLTVFLSILTYTIRRGYFLFGIFFLVYILFTKNIKELIKDKYNWVALGSAILLFFFAEKFIFISQISDVGQAYFHEKEPINFLPLWVFQAYYNNLGLSWASVLFYLFWLGAIILIFNIFLSLGRIKKINNCDTKADFFIIITIILTLAFFIFVLRTQDSFGEPRWYFPLLLGTFICISRASVTLTNYIKPYSKNISIGLLILLIGYGGYYEVQHADFIIKNKIPSYEGIRQAGLYLKEISNENGLIITIARPQIAYYAERSVRLPMELTSWNAGKHYEVPFEAVLEGIKENKDVKYLLVSFSEPNHPEWMKRIQYNQNGQMIVWEIPFMDTKIDFAAQQQDIKQEKTYGDITFRLLDVKQEVFIYEVKRI